MLTSIINYSLNLHQRADCLMETNQTVTPLRLSNIGIHEGDGAYGSSLRVSIIYETICMSTSDSLSLLVHSTKRWET